MSFVRAIDRLRTASGGFTFLHADGSEHTLSYPEIAEEAARRAAVLKARGVRQGDRIALVLPDPQDFVLSFLGVVYAGAVAVPMYPPLSLGKLDQYLDSSARVVSAAGAKLLVTSKQVETILWPVLQKAPGLRDLYTVEKWNEAAASAAPAAAPAVSMQDLVFLQFTSGSTADPKGVRVTHQSLFDNCCALLSAIDCDPAIDMGVSWLPLYHDMGLIGFVLGPLIFKISCTFIPTVSFIKRPALWLDTVSRKKGTITFAPNFAYALVEKRATPEQLAKWDLSSVRVAGCGAEPIQAETIARFTEKFATAKFPAHALMPAYGMAEATLAVAFNPVTKPFVVDVIDKAAYRDHKIAKPVKDGAGLSIVSCGYTFAGHALRIVDDHGKTLGEREVGEIIMAGPSLADGYHERADATAQAFRRGADGTTWLYTGDLGYLVNGELFICGRKKDLIIIKGRNYVPQAIEWTLEQVDGVRKGNVVAFAVQDDSSESAVVVLEARKNPPPTIAADVRRLLNEQYAIVPKDVVVLAPGQLPKTSSGKLQRQKTKTMYQAGTLLVQGSRAFGSSASKVELASHLFRSLRVKVRHRIKQIVSANH
ncbi:MAG: fatty acyl-AMP ligase [Deltaproteobacteria bacterium]|nr:fatty acyl-AMP ligase [Deltaproteobacteria bacterium]